MTTRHGAGIPEGVGGVIVLSIQSVSRGQYVVGMVGLPAAVGTSGRCDIVAAADGTTGWVSSTTAGWSVRVLVPGGLGLVPISSMFRLMVSDLEAGRETERRQYSLRDISTSKSSMLRRSSRIPMRSWRIRCLRHSPFFSSLAGIFPKLCNSISEIVWLKSCVAHLRLL